MTERRNQLIKLIQPLIVIQVKENSVSLRVSNRQLTFCEDVT